MSSLFLAPHNDDETLFGAFTLLRHRPYVVVCLRSQRMGHPSYPGGKPVHYSEREWETKLAMRALDTLWEQWTYPDDAPDWDDIERHLRVLDDQRMDPRWERVFAPCVEIGGNLQHNELGHRALLVFGDRVIQYLTYTADGKSRDGDVVEYEPEWIARKHRALSCYASQASHPATSEHFREDLLEYQVVPE